MEKGERKESVDEGKRERGHNARKKLENVWREGRGRNEETG